MVSPTPRTHQGSRNSEERRKACVDILAGTRTIVVEDDAYGELRFSGRSPPPLKKYLPDQTILTGSLSKIVAPGMRLGWVCAHLPIMDQLVVAKQASDLHSNFLSQRIASRYLEDTDIDAHIRKIRDAYRKQRDCMIATMQDVMPEGVSWTEPEGGMFIWVTLPPGCSSMEVFTHALREQVAVLPGIPFYIDGGGTDTLRLNFSNADTGRIAEGIERLGQVIRSMTR